MRSSARYQPYDLALMRIAGQLDEWAERTVSGGDMRALAVDIRRAVFLDTYEEIAPEATVKGIDE